MAGRLDGKVCVITGAGGGMGRDAAILVTGVEDPDTRAHGIDEGLHLAEFTKVCLAEALLLQNLADQE